MILVREPLPPGKVMDIWTQLNAVIFSTPAMFSKSCRSVWLSSGFSSSCSFELPYGSDSLSNELPT